MPPIRPLLLVRLRPLSRPFVGATRSIPFLPHKPHLRPQIAPSVDHFRTYATNPDPEPSPRSYTFAEIQSFSSTPNPKRILIDVREPSELTATGRIPGAFNMPITTNPDAFHLSTDDFFDRFGFAKPRAREDPSADGDGRGEGVVDEVIFYCRAGVRSRAAARLAKEWEGVKIGDFRGGWLDWEGNGGERKMK